jgi:hypothetical protein
MSVLENLHNGKRRYVIPIVEEASLRTEILIGRTESRFQYQMSMKKALQQVQAV